MCTCPTHHIPFSVHARVVPDAYQLIIQVKVRHAEEERMQGGMDMDMDMDVGMELLAR